MEKNAALDRWHADQMLKWRAQNAQEKLLRGEEPTAAEHAALNERLNKESLRHYQQEAARAMFPGVFDDEGKSN
jgi:hypothetical protein